MHILFAFCLLAFVTALPSAGPQHCAERTTGSPFWNGGPSSALRRIYSGDNDYYYVDFEIGFPPQSVSLLLDTGSSDIWISGPELCHNCTFKTCEIAIQCVSLLPTNCLSDNISVSDSGKLIEKDTLFWENYGYTVTGFYASDEFSIADTTVLNVSFGVVNSTDRKPFDYGGILGIGLIGFQSIAVGCPICGQNAPPLPGLLDQLKAEEVITASTYGIYLGGQSELVIGCLGYNS